jgi:hypothetical protein
MLVHRTTNLIIVLIIQALHLIAPSLTRGRGCNLLLLLVLASTVPRDTIPYFIVPILETPPTWRARSPYLYPPDLPPGHWVPFLSPLTTRRATVEVFYPASTRGSRTQFLQAQVNSWLVGALYYSVQVSPSGSMYAKQLMKQARLIQKIVADG